MFGSEELSQAPNELSRVLFGQLVRDRATPGPAQPARARFGGSEEFQRSQVYAPFFVQILLRANRTKEQQRRTQSAQL